MIINQAPNSLVVETLSTLQAEIGNGIGDDLKVILAAHKSDEITLDDFNVLHNVSASEVYSLPLKSDYKSLSDLATRIDPFVILVLPGLPDRFLTGGNSGF